MFTSDDPLTAPWHALGRGDSEPLTVSGLGGFLQPIFFLPGDSILWMLLSYAPPLAGFLEISTADYGGVLSGFLSTLSWLVLLLVAGMLHHAVRDADRAVTAWIVHAYTDGRRRVRITRALLAQRWRSLLSSEPAAEQSVVEEVELDAQDVRVLELHADLGPGYSLATREVATALGVRRDQAHRILDRLEKLRLLRSTIGGLDGDDAYKLTPSGRAFLTYRQLAPRG